MMKQKVAILYGGRSVEHGVSINSARNIFEYIDKDKFEPYLIGLSTKGIWYLTRSVTKDIEKGEELSVELNPLQPQFKINSSGHSFAVDVVFPVLHGTDGEDGSIQGLLTAISLPIVGSGVLGSAISMSKLVTKRLLEEAGLPTAQFLSYYFHERTSFSFEDIEKQLGLPFMVKSASLGSSVGVSKVKSKADFESAVEEGFRYDHCILFEQYIKGREVECAVLGNLPALASLPGEIIINKSYEFYTFDAKYVDETAVTIQLPAHLDAPIMEKIRSLSLQAYQVLHCEDFARVDLFLTDTGNVLINEINTIPGFTNSSMFPMMWKERGISFTDLITKLIGLALERSAKSKRIQRDFNSSLKF